MKPFEPFEPVRSGGDARGIPTLRVLSGGRLVLNAAAARMLSGVTSVNLMWDEETGRVGLQPAKPSDPNAFKVTSAPSQAIVTSKEFVDLHALPQSTRMRLAWDGSMWVASTNDPANPPNA